MILNFCVFIDGEVLFWRVLISNCVTDFLCIHSGALCIYVNFIVSDGCFNKLLEVRSHFDDEARSDVMKADLTIVLHIASQFKLIKVLHFLEPAFMNLAQLNRVQDSVIEIQDQDTFLFFDEVINEFILLLCQSTPCGDHFSFEAVFFLHLEQKFLQIQFKWINFLETVLAYVWLNLFMLTVNWLVF